MSGIFVTGTNTGVGKTVVCAHLAHHLIESGWDVVTQKWVQTGCTGTAEDILVHDRVIQKVPDPPESAPPELRCPYIFELPASPHLAAARENSEIDPAVIIEAYRALERNHDTVLVEGAGGLNVPLTSELLLGDLAARLHLAALVVVENTLGCINHSLLTVEALRQRNIPIIGLVFNRFTHNAEPLVIEDNPHIIRKITQTPILGSLPPLQNACEAQEDFRQIGLNFQREYEKVKRNE